MTSPARLRVEGPAAPGHNPPNLLRLGAVPVRRWSLRDLDGGYDSATAGSKGAWRLGFHSLRVPDSECGGSEQQPEHKPDHFHSWRNEKDMHAPSEDLNSPELIASQNISSAVRVQNPPLEDSTVPADSGSCVISFEI